jgi:hypothetical protein
MLSSPESFSLTEHGHTSSPRITIESPTCTQRVKGLQGGKSFTSSCARLNTPEKGFETVRIG